MSQKHTLAVMESVTTQKSHTPEQEKSDRENYIEKLVAEHPDLDDVREHSDLSDAVREKGLAGLEAGVRAFKAKYAGMSGYPPTGPAMVSEAATEFWHYDGLRHPIDAQLRIDNRIHRHWLHAPGTGESYMHARCDQVSRLIAEGYQRFVWEKTEPTVPE